MEPEYGFYVQNRITGQYLASDGSVGKVTHHDDKHGLHCNNEEVMELAARAFTQGFFCRIIVRKMEDILKETKQCERQSIMHQQV